MRSKDITDLGVTIDSLCKELKWSKMRFYSRVYRGLTDLEKIRLDKAVLKLKKEVENNAASIYFKKLQKQSISFKSIYKNNKFQVLERWGFSIKEQIEIIL